MPPVEQATIAAQDEAARVFTQRQFRDALGQVATVTQTSPTPSVVVARTDYDSASLPWGRDSFGQLKATLTYNTDGTLATVRDGRNNTTTLSSWKRGVPRSILYANGATQSAVVDDNGWIDSIIEENGYTTAYDYDAMGALAPGRGGAVRHGQYRRDAEPDRQAV
mgnify:CR=1 FL=1